LRDHLLADLSARHRRSCVQLTPEAERVLAGYPWPGNLRELATVLERAVLFTHTPMLGAEDIVASLSAPAVPEASPSPVCSLSLLEGEQQQIRRALDVSATLGEAAARLGINPATLWRKRKRYGLDQRRGGEHAAKQG
jgi:two-component system, NtrC family, response regulator AlgB